MTQVSYVFVGVIGASMSEPHIDEINMKNSVCISVSMYVCLSQSLIQISLTPIATLYYNGFSGRVQNSSRAFIYPRSALCALSWPASCALARHRRNQTAESQVKAASALRHEVAASINQGLTQLAVLLKSSGKACYIFDLKLDSVVFSCGLSLCSPTVV